LIKYRAQNFIDIFFIFEFVKIQKFTIRNMLLFSTEELRNQETLSINILVLIPQ